MGMYGSPAQAEMISTTFIITSVAIILCCLYKCTKADLSCACRSKVKECFANE